MKAKTRNTDNVLLNQPKAQRVFTDREEPRKAFADLYARAVRERGSDNCYVLSYYGRGGIGKTSLLKVLYEQSQHDNKYCVFYDMLQGSDRRLVLTRLRNMLVSQYPKQFSFDYFDLALLRFSELAGAASELTQKETKTIIERNPMLSAAFDYISYIPVAGSVTGVIDFLTKGYHHYHDITEAHRQNLIAAASGIEKLNVKELHDRLPEYFSTDLENSCKKLDSPLIIFIDTYEQLVNYMRDIGLAEHDDKWLRGEIIPYVPNCLWVIAGRDKLRWREIDTAWQNDDGFEDHFLGALSEQDSISFLEKAGITDAEACRKLYSMSDGDPLALDLYVTAWHDIIRQGSTPRADDFALPSEMVVRYLQNMDNAHKALAELLACYGHWTDKDIQQIAPRILGSYNVYDYEALRSSSLVQPGQNEDYYMHRIVRDAIRMQIPDQRFQEYMSGIREAGNDIDKTGFSVNYISCISDSIERLIAELKHGISIEASAKDIINRIRPLQKQGNYLDVMHLLEPVYRYEEKAHFRDQDAFTILTTYLGTVSYNDMKPRFLSETKKLYDAYCAAGFGNKQVDELLSKLISAYTMNLQFDKAIELTDQCLNDISTAERNNSEKTYNRYITLLHQKGVALFGKHRYNDAIAILSEVLDWKRIAVQSDKDKKRTLCDTLFYLAAAYNNIRNHEKALALYEEDQCIWLEEYSEDYPNCIQLSNNIALQNYHLGAKEKAISIWEHAIEICRSKYGEEDSLCLNMMNNLANACKNDPQQIYKALELYQKVYEISDRKYPPGHPDRYSIYNTLHNVSLAYALLPDKDKALKLDQEALQGFHETVGPYHPESLMTLYTLVGRYQHAGEYVRAIEISEEAEETVRRHPDLELRYKNQLEKLRKHTSECRGKLNNS